MHEKRRVFTSNDDGIFTARTKSEIAATIKALAGRAVDVIVQPHQRSRSLDQNAWIWGVAYPILAKHLGYDRDEIEDLHYGLVAKWGGEHFDKRLGAMVPNKRSSKLTTREFSDYMEWLVRFSAKECGCIVPLPDEQAA